jgi:hypothetical protein
MRHTSPVEFYCQWERMWHAAKKVFMELYLKNFVTNWTAEGLVDPLMYKKTVTGFRYPRACRIRKYQIENRLQSLVPPSTNFFQNVI